MRSIWLATVLAACASNHTGPVGFDPKEGGNNGKADGGGGVPYVRCAGVPDAGPAGSFNHFSSEAISALGDAKHRGFDPVVGASSDPQSIEGWAAYTIADKSLEDEDVDVFACRESAWQKIGTARTDDNGHFALVLSGADRLPIGMRDMYMSIVGDRTGAAFLAYVGPDGAPLLISDVDGTLTSSENAFVETITLGVEPDEQPGASDAYQQVAAKGYAIVYVTSRGNQYTQDTRQWLDDKGFPRGPVRLATSFITLPGADTVDYKTSTISAIAADGLTLFAGVGNRATDVTAYMNTNIAADHTFVKLPEFQSEVQSDLDAGLAIGVPDYSAWAAQYVASW